MADFLVVVGDGARTARWMERGLAIARARGRTPESTATARSGRAAGFARQRTPGSRVVERDGTWLLSAGSWFGPDGISNGAELALLDLIRTRGLAAVLADVDGFFTLIVGDRDGVRVATDAVGSHHVHVRHANGVTAIAGSALELAALDDDALDPIGCQEMLATGVIYEDRTPWASVRSLPPASIVSIGPRGAGPAQRWWSIGSLEPDSLSGDAAVDAFGSAMLDIVSKIGRRFAHPVSDLTAGWDSRLLAGFLRAAGVAFETTVTGPADSADVVLSGRIAARLGIAHLALPLGGPPTADEVFATTELTDGLVNAIGYARVLRVHRELSERFDVSLNGSFGEVARGYWWEILAGGPDRRGPLDAAQLARVRYAVGVQPSPLWAPAERFEPAPHYADLIARTDATLDRDAPRAFRLDHTYLRLRMRSWQGRIASSTDRLWPCLSPLIARPALEALLRTRSSDRIHSRLARRILARFAPELAAMPLESGGPALPRTLGNSWRFAPELWRFARRATNKVLGRRTYARTLEETAGPRLSLLAYDRIRVALDPATMVLGDHVDRDALRRLVTELAAPESERDLLFGNLLALESGLARVRELRRT